MKLFCVNVYIYIKLCVYQLPTVVVCKKLGRDVVGVMTSSNSGVHAFDEERISFEGIDAWAKTVGLSTGS